MLNKKLGATPQPPSTTLKNIINETKTPLAKYIHKKTTAADKSMSYLEYWLIYHSKLKAMLMNNPKFQPRLREAANYVHTQTNTINHEMQEQTPAKRRHERTQSHLAVLATTHVHTSSKNANLSPSPRLGLSQKKINGNLLNEIKTDLVLAKKRVTSTVTPVQMNTIYGSNRVKRQIINYSKFTRVSKSGSQDLDQQICSKWGKMDLAEVLGSGVNASVREGTCNGIKYAVKVYQKYKLLDLKKKRRVYSQIELLSQMQGHPNVITMHQAFENKREIHVVFEHLQQSMTLHQYFRSHMLFLAEEEARRIFCKMVRGVAHLHEDGIAHRDIKPDNVLVHFDEDGEMVVKIIDFGFATLNSVADLHCGTPNFMAPELLERTGKYSTLPVDVWALGVTLFYLCEGRYPFKGYDEKDLFRSIRHGIYEFKKLESPKIRALIGEMLNPDPKTRITLKQLMKREWVSHI